MVAAEGAEWRQNGYVPDFTIGNTDMENFFCWCCKSLQNVRTARSGWVTPCRRRPLINGRLHLGGFMLTPPKTKPTVNSKKLIQRQEFFKGVRCPRSCPVLVPDLRMVRDSGGSFQRPLPPTPLPRPQRRGRNWRRGRRPSKPGLLGTVRSSRGTRWLLGFGRNSFSCVFFWDAGKGLLSPKIMYLVTLLGHKIGPGGTSLGRCFSYLCLPYFFPGNGGYIVFFPAKIFPPRGGGDFI